MSNKRKWEGYQQKVAKKRLAKKNESSTSSADAEYLTVQRLSSSVEGKCQKYARIGPLTMVPLDKQPATLDSIKRACQKHFRTSAECDVLAGERGPSFTDVNQIKNWKVIHIRFLEGSHRSLRTIENDSDIRVVLSDDEHRQSIRSEQVRGTTSLTVSKLPASVPLSEMLKIGKLIKPKKEVITLQLEEFILKEKRWQDPMEVKLSVNTEKLGSGGFRDAFETNMISGLRPGKYVLKRYKKDTVPTIMELFGSVEIHTRKSVQMNALARNFAMTLEQEKPEEFGNTFAYNKVYFAKHNEEYITLEDYIDGPFRKYINNNGVIFPSDPSESEVALKAETYCHYTYVKSGEQLMVLDIQGVNFSLCDPEIASAYLRDTTDQSILFCSGNCFYQAIQKFLDNHNCNKYCELLKLSQ